MAETESLWGLPVRLIERRGHGYTVEDFPCMRCQRTVSLFWNGGGLDEVSMWARVLGRTRADRLARWRAYIRRSGAREGPGTGVSEWAKVAIVAAMMVGGFSVGLARGRYLRRKAIKAHTCPTSVKMTEHIVYTDQRMTFMEAYPSTVNERTPARYIIKRIRRRDNGYAYIEQLAEFRRPEDAEEFYGKLKAQDALAPVQRELWPWP